MKILDIITENQAGVQQGRLNEFAPGGGEGNGPFDYGPAIIQIGQDFAEFYDDEGTDADARAIIKVGNTFMSAGMEAGIRAFYAMDTQVRDHVAEQLMDQGFNVRQDIYQPYDQQFTAAEAANGIKTILALLKEFLEEYKWTRSERKIVEGIYKAFQQGMEPGFVALRNAFEFDIDADFYDFARDRGIDLDQVAARAGFDTDSLHEGKQGVSEASDEIRDRLAQMRSNTQDRLNTMRSNTQDRLRDIRSNTQDRLSTMRSGTSATAPSKPAPAAGPRSPRVGDTIEFGKFNSPDRRRGKITQIKGPIVTVKTDKGEEEIHLQNKSLSYSIVPPEDQSQLTEVDNSTWLRALRRLESGAEPKSDIEWALKIKLDGVDDPNWDVLARYGFDVGARNARDIERGKIIWSLIQAAPELGELEQAARQQATDQQQAARQQAKDQLTHELDLKALSQQHDLSQADTQALTQMDAAARLALRQQMQEMQLEAKERLAQVEIDIRNSQEPEADRKFQLQQAQENYQHEISVLKITQEGEYKKALLEANYQIRIKELELIDNREERQNQLDKLNAEKSRELAVIDAETRAKIQVIQAEVDADAQRAAVDLQVEYMQAFKPIWADMLDKASQYGRTLSQQISSVVGALGRLTDVKVPRPVAEGHGPVELMRSYLDLLNEQQQQQDITEASGNAAKMARVAKRCARQAFKDTDRPDSRMFLKAAEYFAAGDEARGLRTIERMDTEARDDFYMGCEDAGIPIPPPEPGFFDSLPDLELTPAQKKYRKAMHKALGLPLDEDQTK